MDNKVPVIIPCVDERIDLLEPCIESLGDWRDDLDVWVVAGDSPKLADWSMGHNLKCLISKDRLSFAQANNYAMKETKGNVVILMNNDIRADVKVLMKMAEHVKLGKAEIAGPKMVYGYEGRLGNLVQSAGMWFVVSLGGLRAVNGWRFAHKDHPVVCAQLYLIGLPFSCVAINRSVWELIGGLDEAFVNGWDDVDFCLQLRAAGGRAYYDGTLEVVHLESQTALQNSPFSPLQLENMPARVLYQQKWWTNGRSLMATGVTHDFWND